MNKIYDAVMGFVVGDALGVPYEFKKRNTFKCKGMSGFGTHHQPAGTWSDDSSMMLATLSSIYYSGIIRPESIMDNFCKWYYTAEFTARGSVFDFGNTTAQAIINYEKNKDWKTCGGTSEFSNGNGSLMRILPLAFIDSTAEDINNISLLTHNTEICKFACRVYIEIIRDLLNNDLNSMEDFLIPIKKMKKSQIKSDGYVINTLIAALWAFLNSHDYRSCVLKAVNLGNDTDTVAAIAGAMAGIRYGANDIPKPWLKKIARRDWIKNLCDNFDKKYVQT